MESTFGYVTRQQGIKTLWISGGWSVALLEEMRKGLFSHLSIDWGNWGDFSKLAEFVPIIKGLLVHASDLYYPGFERLTELREILLEGIGTDPLDIGKLRKLTSARLYWRKQYAHGLFGLPDLSELWLTKLVSDDCRALSTLPSLAEFELIQSRVRSLAGLDSVSGLRRIQLTSVTLADLGSISTLPALVDVHISGARKLTDISELFRCTRLKRIWIHRTSVESMGLDWLENLPDLQSLVIDVPVSATNLATLFRHSSLQWIALFFRSADGLDTQQLESLATKFGKTIYDIRRGRRSGLFQLVLGIKPQPL